MYAPNIDATQSRLGSVRTTVLIPRGKGEPPEQIPVTLENFEVRLNLEPGSQVLRADYHHRKGPMKIQRVIALHPVDPVIIDEWTFAEGEGGILHQSIPWMGSSTSAHCSLFHPVFNGVVHHRGRRWVGFLADSPLQWVQVGHLSEQGRQELWNGARVAPPLESSALWGYPSGPVRDTWDQVVQGCATWGAFASGSARRQRFLLVCAESERHLGKLLTLLRATPTRRFLNMIEGAVAKRHAPAQLMLERVRNPAVRALCERSIDVLHALQDARTGALMAAAEVDPHSRFSGGYGFSWPRDGAYLATALGAFGFHDRVEHYLRFCSETQDPSGAWWQRYLATGHAGPSWGRIQIDEPATVIGAAFVHYRRTHDLFWLERFWPTIQQGLKFLEDFHGPQHPHGLPSHDLWEERMGVHAYSMGAVISAFRCGSYLARQLGDREAQSRYYAWARKLIGLFEESFVAHDGAKLRRSFIAEGRDFAMGQGRWDELTDTSLLGLIAPFAILHPRHPAAVTLVKELHEKLWSRPHGGLLRYEWDSYRGGNPWILTTLWLGGIELMRGRIPEARECFQWSMSKATPQGMLAEQVSRETGKPMWVIPLGWSHAMFLLFVREVLARKLQNQIWETL